MACTLVAVLLPLNLLAAPAVRIAVTNFSGSTATPEFADLGRAIADMVATDLALADDLSMVERSQLKQVLAGIGLLENPYFDTKTATLVGRGLTASYLVVGDYLIMKSSLRIDARLVDVESEEIVTAVTVSGTQDSYFELQQQLVGALLNQMGATLSVIQRKQLGKSGSKDLGALARYGEALRHQSAGDTQAERAALEAALVRDGEFLAVRERLDTLVQLIQRVERSGGLILDASSVQDHIHNANLHAAAGRLQAATSSTHLAIAVAPEWLEPWLLLEQLHAQGPGELPSVPTGERALLEALIGGDRAAVRKALQSETKTAVALASAFLVLSSNFEPPIRDVEAMLTLRGALDALSNPELLELARARLQDPAALDRKLESLKKRMVAPYQDWMTRRGVRAAFRYEADGLQNATPRHAMWLTTLQPTQTEANLTFRKGTHPHWKSPRWAKSSRVQDMTWLLRVFVRGQAMPYEELKLKQKYLVPASAFECEDNTASPTGWLCTAQFAVHENAPPGCYEIRLSPVKSRGKSALADPCAWILDFRLGRSYGPIEKAGSKQFHMSSDSATVHPIRTAMEREYWTRFSAIRAMGDEAGAVTRVCSRWRHRQVAYDLDYKLADGKSPETQADWIAYRDAILDQGYSIDGARLSSKGKTHSAIRCAYLPLPQLSAGRHTLCLASLPRRGGKNAEAECFHIAIDSE